MRTRRVAQRAERRRRHHLRQPRPRHHRRRRRPRHGRRRRAGRLRLRRQRLPAAPRRRAGDAHDATDDSTQPALPDAVRRPALQPHRPRRRRARRARNQDNSGQLAGRRHRRGVPRPDGAPWWAEYVVTDLLHTFAFDEGTAGAGSFGNDYLAGGAAPRRAARPARQRRDPGRRRHRGRVRAAVSHVGALAHAGRLRDRRRASSATTSATSTSSRSFERATDGEDYIEGNGGNDVRSSAASARTTSSAAARPSSASITADQRPDGTKVAGIGDRGADLIFGGSGTARRPQRRLRPRALPTSTTPATRTRSSATTATSSASSASTTSTSTRRPTRRQPLYVTFNYDNYGADEARRPRRRPARLHAGRPGLPARACFGLDGRAAARAAARRRPACAAHAAGHAATAPASTPTSAATTRSHGESGDDTDLRRLRQRRASSATPATTT